jgi:hypothetical protein
MCGFRIGGGGEGRVLDVWINTKWSRRGKGIAV